MTDIKYWVWIILSIATMFFVLNWEGKVVIQQGSYLPELRSCQTKLSETVKACPEVKCDCGWQGVGISVMGSIFLITGILAYWRGLKKLSQEPKEPQVPTQIPNIVPPSKHKRHKSNGKTLKRRLRA